MGIIILSYNSPLTLSWTISNGPASYTFYPPNGGCTSGSNSYGGVCITDPYTRNAPPPTLYVANAYGSANCTTNIKKICVENSARIYTVYTGFTGGDIILPNGSCATISWLWILSLTPGTRITLLSSYGTCSGFPVGTFSYETAVCLDDNGDGKVVMDYGNETGRDA